MGCYMTLGADNIEQAHAFYDRDLAEIDWASHMTFPGWRAYSEQGSGEGFVLWVCKPFDGENATTGNGTMLGFNVGSHAQVDAFDAVAMQNGAHDEGAPGLRPQYGQTGMLPIFGTLKETSSRWSATAELQREFCS